MLNSNGGNNGHGLKDVTCKQTFSPGIPSLNIVEPHLVEPLRIVKVPASIRRIFKQECIPVGCVPADR